MKKDRRCDSCQAHVMPKTTSWMRVQRTTRALVDSDWSRNSASRSCRGISEVFSCYLSFSASSASSALIRLFRLNSPFLHPSALSPMEMKPKNQKAELLTRWNICSLLISCNLPFKSLTFCTISPIFSLSSLSILLVSPIARSRVILTPPRDCPPSQPECPDACEGVKQILWSPESAAVNVKRPSAEPLCEMTRWSLSKISCRYHVNSYNNGGKDEIAHARAMMLRGSQPGAHGADIEEWNRGNKIAYVYTDEDFQIIILFIRVPV
jgi:hypothetical protein